MPTRAAALIKAVEDGKIAVSVGASRARTPSRRVTALTVAAKVGWGGREPIDIPALCPNRTTERLVPTITGGVEHMRAFYKHRHRILGIAAHKYGLGQVEACETISVLTPTLRGAEG